MATKKKALLAAAGAAGGGVNPIPNGWIVWDNWISGVYDGAVRAYDFDGANPGALFTTGTPTTSSTQLSTFQHKETGCGIWTARGTLSNSAPFRVINADSNGDIVYSEIASAGSSDYLVAQVAMSNDGLTGFFLKSESSIQPMSRDSLDDTWTLGSSKNPSFSIYQASTNSHFMCFVEGSDDWVIVLDNTRDTYAPDLAVYDYSTNTKLSVTLAGDNSSSKGYACANSGYVNGNYFYTFYVAGRNDPASGIDDSYVYRARVDLTTGAITRTKINSSIFNEDSTGYSIQSCSFYPHNGALSLHARLGTYTVGVMEINMETNSYSVIASWPAYYNSSAYTCGPYDLDNDVLYVTAANSEVYRRQKTSLTSYTALNPSISFSSPGFTVYANAPIYSEAFAGTAPWES
jgi:hypothetical protein